MYKSLGTEKIKIEDYAGMNIYEGKAKLELKELKVISSYPVLSSISIARCFKKSSFLGRIGR